MRVVPSARIPANKVVARMCGLYAQVLSGKTARVLCRVVLKMKSGFYGARTSVLVSAIAAAFSTGVHAQSSSTLAEVVVTATRSESRVSDVISDVSIITRRDIEANSGRTLVELLSRVSGVQMSANGGLGKNSTLFIRGTDSRHVMLLVDGVRYGSSTTGAPNFDTIPLESIDHIEVLKGPASAMYGSDAIGGVIQVFTRKGLTGIHPYASITAGEYNHAEVTAGVSGGDERISYVLGAQTLNEAGFSATNPRSSSYNPDNDGFTQNSANLSLTWKLTDDWKLLAHAMQSEGVSQSDNGTKSKYDVHTNSFTGIYFLGLEGKVSKDWSSKVTWSSGQDNSLYFSSATPSKTNNQQDQTTWQNEVQTSAGTVLVGLENLREYVSSSTNFAVTSRATDSQYVGLSGTSGAHSWQVNARHDSNSQFGDANTGLLGYGYALSPAWRLHGSLGTSFKAPTFNDLYYPNFSNPQLLPEVGRNTEAGISYALGESQISLTYYVNRIQNYVGKNSAFVPFNIPQASIEGATLSIQGEAGNWRYYSALDVINARNESTGLRLQRRPDTQLTAGLDYESESWSYGVSLLAVTDFYDDVKNSQPLGGYATVDAHVGYAIKKDWSIEGRVVNLGDKFYQTAYGYNQSGRAMYVTLRFQPK